MLEVCVDSVDGTRRAIEGGAQRIEISECLKVGGVTPSAQLVQTVRQICQLPLIALVRCRPGDFHYHSEELETMLSEIRIMMDLGCDGVAVGASHRDDDLDMWFMDEALRVARRTQPSAQMVVHRVFDSVPDKFDSLDRLIESGYNRILTSGGKEHAIGSLDALRDLQAYRDGRIAILPGGGVQASNAATILESTGCRELHGSFTRGATTIDTGLPIVEEVRTVRGILDDFLTSDP